MIRFRPKQLISNTRSIYKQKRGGGESRIIDYKTEELIENDFLTLLF